MAVVRFPAPAAGLVAALSADQGGCRGAVVGLYLGACVGVPKCSGVVCPSPTECQVAVVCEPTTGLCPLLPSKPRGTEVR